MDTRDGAQQAASPQGPDARGGEIMNMTRGNIRASMRKRSSLIWEVKCRAINAGMAGQRNKGLRSSSVVAELRRDEREFIASEVKVRKEN